MRKKNRSGSASSVSRSPGYVLSESSRGTLIRTAEHLHLLSRVSAARIVYDAEEFELSPDALMASFERLACALDEVVQGAKWRAS
ncbi:XAC0095 family protein [Lysobacter panacisoli]|uniref:XAC0095-like domain-containing protein n=1 Tax=Lysobacter panacisoli TaxID=1255263 RepID=A0ABP9LF74_9GAMM|nr:hypothetical protein [Lysobacter panacisoli]